MNYSSSDLYTSAPFETGVGGSSDLDPSAGFLLFNTRFGRVLLSTPYCLLGSTLYLVVLFHIRVLLSTRYFPKCIRFGNQGLRPFASDGIFCSDVHSCKYSCCICSMISLYSFLIPSVYSIPRKLVTLNLALTHHGYTKFSSRALVPKFSRYCLHA
eukprot:SAG31_NODE_3262_length_4482_cov_8.132101_1_plen_155_part_10